VGCIAALWGQGDVFLKCETTPASHDSNQLGPVSWWYIELFLVVKVSVPFSLLRHAWDQGERWRMAWYVTMLNQTHTIRSDNVFQLTAWSQAYGYSLRLFIAHQSSLNTSDVYKIKWWPDAIVDIYQMVYQLNKQSLKKKKRMIRQ